jgi:hypothetical protein
MAEQAYFAADHASWTTESIGSVARRAGPTAGRAARMA